MRDQAPLRSYTFPTTEYRAAVLRVIDGDTLEVFVDRGNYAYTRWRVRLLGVDTPELHAKTAEERARAQDAKAQVVDWLRPPRMPNLINLDFWPLRLCTRRDPDSFGRLLADVYWTDDAGAEHHLNVELISAGLAVPYVPG